MHGQLMNRRITLGATRVSVMVLTGRDFDRLDGFDPSAQPRGYTPAQAPAQQDAGPASGHAD